MAINKALIEERRKINRQIRKLEKRKEAVEAQIVLESAPVKEGDKISFREYYDRKGSRIRYGIVDEVRYFGEEEHESQRNPGTRFTIVVKPTTKTFGESRRDFAFSFIDEKGVIEKH